MVNDEKIGETPIGYAPTQYKMETQLRARDYMTVYFKPSPPHWTVPVYLAPSKEAIAAERNRLLDECLGICDMKMSEVLLACGELSRQEIRTVQAVLDMMKRKIEALRHE